MTSAFSWQNSVSLCPASFCTLRPNLSVTLGISWSPLSGLKGVKPPVKFREKTRDCSPGQTGKEVPNIAMKVGLPELRRQCGVSHEV